MKPPSDIKLRYIEVIDWVETQDGVLSYRFPMKDREIPSGAQLTVRESQLALFLDEGKLADIFSPGRYMLTTKTLPLLMQLKKWDEHFRSPFKSDVFFFSTREQLNQKWGTPEPITVRDVELGPIRIRAHGTYSFRLKNPRLFFEKVSGTTDLFTVAQLDGQLRALIVGVLRHLFGNAQVPFIDMAANQAALTQELQRQAAARFPEYGLELATLTVQGISLPKEMQAHFDKVASMRMIGDVQKYFVFQAAESLTQPGGKDSANSVGVGIGIGMSLGRLLQQQGDAAKTPPSAKTLPETTEKKEDDTIATISQLRELQKKGLLSDDELQKKIAALLRKKP